MIEWLFHHSDGLISRQAPFSCLVSILLERLVSIPAVLPDLWRVTKITHHRRKVLSFDLKSEPGQGAVGFDAAVHQVPDDNDTTRKLCAFGGGVLLVQELTVAQKDERIVDPFFIHVHVQGKQSLFKVTRLLHGPVHCVLVLKQRVNKKQRVLGVLT